MKTAAFLASLALAFTASTARAEPIAWRILGSNPDVYAPVYPQPVGHDYFDERQNQTADFEHPAFAASFARLRMFERDEANRSLTDARSGSKLMPALLMVFAPAGGW